MPPLHLLTLEGAAKGALWGAVTAGVAYGVAEGVGYMTNINAHGSSFLNGGVNQASVTKAIAHGLSRAGIQKMRYGTGKGAFLSGFVSSGFSVGKGAGPGGAFAMAIVGGTTSVIGGGKFANGAMGSAFQYLFNDWFSDMKAKVNGNVMRNEQTRKQTMQNLALASKNVGDSLDNISTGLGGLAAIASIYPVPQVQLYSKSLEIGSILADGGKQFFYYLANDIDGGSILVDVVGASIPVPNRVLDFAIDEAVDKGYGALK